MTRANGSTPRATAPIYVLGGSQTDFVRNWTREGTDLVGGTTEVVQSALVNASVDAADIEVGHVGNFAAEIYSGQGHLGGLLVEAEESFVGIPTSRHEAACASGSVAVLAAMADIEAGRYSCALVLGIEHMRMIDAFASQKVLGAAAWVPRETDGVEYPWPQLFSELGDEYDRRYGLSFDHLAALAKMDFENARRNPNAQTRRWAFEDSSFTEDSELNPVVAGRIRRQDCSQVTDGAAAIVLASKEFASEWARARGQDRASIPRITGWGHHTGRMALADKLASSRDGEFVVPHVRNTITDAYDRAGVTIDNVRTIETHDCFTTTQYMAIDHLGLTKPGQSWQAIEEGTINFDGPCPINPTGGLIGLGHPVGATGVRMVLDASRQVSGKAQDCQVPGAVGATAATLNLGGSATTAVCFVLQG